MLESKLYKCLFYMTVVLAASHFFTKSSAISENRPAGVEYNLHLCAEYPPEKLYVRLPAGYEFGFEQSYITHLTPRVPDTTGLPRDRSVPTGCRLNPVSLNGIHLRWPAGALQTEHNENIKEGWKVRDFFIRGRVGENNDHKKYGLQRKYIQFYEQYSEIAASIRALNESISEDLDALFSRNPIHNTEVRDGITYVIAKPGSYEEIQGARYVTRCTGALVPGGAKRCRVNYLLGCNLFVHYQFFTDVVDIEDSINLDREIRNFLRDRVIDAETLASTIDCVK